MAVDMHGHSTRHNIFTFGVSEDAFSPVTEEVDSCSPHPALSVFNCHSVPFLSVPFLRH
jgi:hypothetical protein